jgi:hypothetical protein
MGYDKLDKGDYASCDLHILQELFHTIPFQNYFVGESYHQESYSVADAELLTLSLKLTMAT